MHVNVLSNVYFEFKSACQMQQWNLTKDMDWDFYAKILIKCVASLYVVFLFNPLNSQRWLTCNISG